MIEMAGLSVYSVKAEWPNFFRFVVSILMFLAARLVFRVYQSNKRTPAPATAPTASADSNVSAASSPAAPPKPEAQTDAATKKSQ
jgi:hypothetical protein